MVRPERFELPAFWFVARRSIQLSYGRTVRGKILSCRTNCRQEYLHESIGGHGPGNVENQGAICAHGSACHKTRSAEFINIALTVKAFRQYLLAG
jgi:hypothetical protein